MIERDPAALPRRLRQLREERWPDVKVTQQHVATALGVGLSSVSSWENTRIVKVPPRRRLHEYAVLFATRRSFERGGVLLGLDDLTTDERADHDRLAAELEGLRAVTAGEAAQGGVARPRRLWQFGPGETVRIICASNPDRGPHASARHRNYMQLAGYADVDSLVELFGHIRACNPDADVQFELAERLESDDLKSHLVVLGGLNRVTAWTAGVAGLPVEQEADESVPDGEVFRLAAEPATRFPPALRKDELVSDVGLFFRTTNPFNSSRTLTICSGSYTRGVYGAVRMLTDKELRDQNEDVLRAMFGDSTTFGLLMRVPIFEHATVTPDLRNQENLLHHWPASEQR